MNEPSLAERMTAMREELGRLEREYPRGSAERTPGLDSYIRALLARLEALQAKTRSSGGREIGP